MFIYKYPTLIIYSTVNMLYCTSAGQQLSDQKINGEEHQLIANLKFLE